MEPRRRRSKPSKLAVSANSCNARCMPPPCAARSSPMRMIERACVALLLVVLSACSGGSAPTAAQPAPPPAELIEGDLRIIATIVPTTALPEKVTRGYGIARGEDVWMLLVAVRRGPEGKDTSVPAKVDASARDLQG